MIVDSNGKPTTRTPQEEENKQIVRQLCNKNWQATANTIVINDQLISNCSRLPNVQLIKHDNLFANQPNILYDHKHILKRHIGLFAKNLKDAIHGRAQRRTPRNHPASPQGGSPLLHHTSFSNAIKNTPPHTYHWPNDPQTRPQAMPLVKPRLQQQVTPAPHQAATNQTLAAPHQYPNALKKIV